MFETSDSHQPLPGLWDCTEVQATDPSTVSTMSEIKLYLSCVASMWVWLFYLYQCRDGETWCADRFTTLRTSYIDKLPAQQELTKTYACDPPTQYYRSRYALYDLQSTLSVSRPVILMNVTNLLNYMSQCQPHFQQHLTPDQYSQCQRHLASTKSAFESWMTLARPHVIPPVASLRRSEETGRRPHTAPVGSNLPRRVHYISLLYSRLEVMC